MGDVTRILDKDRANNVKGIPADLAHMVKRRLHKEISPPPSTSTGIPDVLKVGSACAGYLSESIALDCATCCS